MYQTRLAVVRDRLDAINHDMTRDRRGSHPVPLLAHVKVLQAIVQTRTAIRLLDADKAKSDPTA